MSGNLRLHSLVRTWKFAIEKVGRRVIHHGALPDSNPRDPRRYFPTDENIPLVSSSCAFSLQFPDIHFLTRLIERSIFSSSSQDSTTSISREESPADYLRVKFQLALPGAIAAKKYPHGAPHLQFDLAPKETTRLTRNLIDIVAASLSRIGESYVRRHPPSLPPSSFIDYSRVSSELVVHFPP